MPDDLQDGACIHRRVPLRQVAALQDEVEQLPACMCLAHSAAAKKLPWHLKENRKGQNLHKLQA